MKYLGIDLTECVQDVYVDDYSILVKEIKTLKKT